MEGFIAMDIDKLNKWANLLLDTGKRNNLISFKDSKATSVELVSPDFDTVFLNAGHGAVFEVYDPKLENEDEPLDVRAFSGLYGDTRRIIEREEYISLYEPRLKRNNQILVYNQSPNPISALKNIASRAKTAIEERGVNIAYIAFGFINWTEAEKPDHIIKAPVLLMPITVENESSVDPYRIKITDDVIVNPTFSFKLKNEFGIELPEYTEDSVDEYFEKINERICKLKWRVTKECKIGIFSFQKINMHVDLKENAEKILKNNGVLTLLGEADASVSDNEALNIKEDAGLNSVVDADSSQIEAILLAREGKSFVLQGPPGTGKSQTITNIIAECLSLDKKVLFVSEKLAALNVVYGKLKSAGLEEFCLELHSHKANKKDVIDELCHTLRLGKSALSDRAKKELDAKTRAEEELDKYESELHKTRPTINKTLYQLYEEISAVRLAPDLEFVINKITEKGEEYINEVETALTRYVEYTDRIGYDYRKNCWYGYADLDATYQSRLELKQDLRDLITLTENLKAINKRLSGDFSASAENMYQAYALKDLFAIFKDSEFVTPALLNQPTLAKLTKTLSEMQKISREILKCQSELDTYFDEDIYKLDGALTRKELLRQYSGLFKRVFSRRYAEIVRQIRLSKKDGRRVGYDFAMSSLLTLENYQKHKRSFSELEKNLSNIIGDGYCGFKTDFDKLMGELGLISDAFKTGVNLGKISKYTYPDFKEKRESFSGYHSELTALFDSLSGAERRVVARFNKDEYDLRASFLDTLLEKITSCLDNIDKLDDYCEFLKLLSTLSRLEIKSFVDCTIKKQIRKESVLDAYKRAFYTQWVDSILHESDFLIRLSRIPHDETVKLFSLKDELQFSINQAKIKAQLSRKRPNLDMIARGSAISVLLREGEKKRKQKAIRPLLDEIGALVQTLKPCFLMSPLSVSTYLGPDMKFDVVIFDEASQIFPEDAIGAIYRAKQLIVVGDSKQMPPSNFFNSTAEMEQEDETDDVTDFESILDICSTSFPQKRLRWHYRSRFEQLIAFSNKNYYENDLVTFPSAKKDGQGVGVDYFYVDGVFDRQTKTNLKEAEKIVDLVFENIEKYPERSLGVVAFSISQQSLIEKLIAKRRRTDLSKEAFFKSDKEEPFFVKNLETVQGDERDTIIFSVAYGKGSDGRLLLNFGPINKKGGERRLNVAVTRAKYNVMLVSSMHYTDIDPQRSQSVGVRLLREYLDYAENGTVALKRSEADNPFEVRESEFIMEVRDFLRAKGFSVDVNVGCSSLKIDLALKSRDSSDYVMAIECDGEGYHFSKSARDRDRLRAEVLSRMGWKFYRVWSTDWFRNKRVEKDRLLKAATVALENASSKGQNPEKKKNADSFEELFEISPFEFPKYQYTDEYKAAEKYCYAKTSVINAIITAEAPISEEWLLKRIAFLFGREKVSSVVREEFYILMRHSANYNIVKKDGFWCVSGKPTPMLRVPDENGGVIRDIKYIPTEELALGMKEIIRLNVSVEKEGLFRLLAEKLGYSRIGDAIFERMELALKSISESITQIDGFLSLK